MRPLARRWVALGLLALAPSAFGQDPGDPLRERLDAMREVTSTEGSLSMFRPATREFFERELDRIELELEAGNWKSALNPLATLIEYLGPEGITLPGEPFASLEALEARAEELREQFANYPPPGDGAGQRPAVVQAQLEVAYTKAHGYLTSGFFQGRETGLDNGAYYLKVGVAALEWADDLRAIRVDSVEHPRVEAASLGTYLDSVQAELMDLYRPPLAKDLHSTFIRLSAGLKVARELAQAGFELGALHETLEVVRGMSAVEQDGSHDLQALSAEIERQRRALAARTDDVSMLEAWLGDAIWLMDSPEAEPGEIAALIERVPSDYAKALATETEATEEAAAVDSHVVTVTLVRWPFT